MKVFGDLIGKRAIQGEVRVDRGLRVTTITTAETLDKNAYSWQKLRNNTSTLAVNLPTATTLMLGWAVVVENPAASTFNLTIKDASAGTIKTLIPGVAYEFTCQDIGSAAGVWNVTELGDTAVLSAPRYAQNFNNTTDWGTAAGGYYTITVTGATHTRGINPIARVFETSGAVESEVELDLSYDNTTGDVSLAVPETPDCRFTGRTVIV